MSQAKKEIRTRYLKKSNLPFDLEDIEDGKYCGYEVWLEDKLITALVKLGLEEK